MATVTEGNVAISAFVIRKDEHAAGPDIQANTDASDAAGASPSAST
jgi:hypothetical protein